MNLYLVDNLVDISRDHSVYLNLLYLNYSVYLCKKERGKKGDLNVFSMEIFRMNYRI